MNRARDILILGTAAVAAALAGRWVTGGDNDGPEPTSIMSDSAAVMPYQLVAVYVGQSTCPWCSRPETATAIEVAFSRLRRAADSIGAQFHSIGVAAEPDSDAGLDYLKGVWPFDELAVGGHWVNAAALRYVWDIHHGTGAVPQVIVLARSIRTPTVVNSPLFAVDREVVLVRKTGMFEIAQWAGAGAPLPAFSVAGGANAFN